MLYLKKKKLKNGKKKRQNPELPNYTTDHYGYQITEPFQQ